MRTALMAAAHSGCAPVVSTLLERGAEINSVMIQSLINAGHEAAREGHLEVLQVWK